MHPGFQSDPAPRHPAEHFLHSFRSRAQPLFEHHLTCFIQHAIPARAIPQIQPDREPLFGKIPDLLRRCGANLLHCRSPLSLVLSSTSITWERTASRRRLAFSSHLFATATALRCCTAPCFSGECRVLPRN